MTDSYRKKPSQRSRAGAILALGAAALAIAAGHDSPAQEPATWSAAARLLAPAAPEMRAAPNMPARTASDPPTRGLPPQYQTTLRHDARGEPQPDDAGVRFVVMLVERPILVDAKITVDGRPFRMLREALIDRLLQQPAEPVEPAAPDLPPAQPEAEANAGTAEDPGSDSKPPPDNSFSVRLRRYAAATRRSPTRAEVHWLLTNWADGPTLLFLDENYQRVRAGASPLFRILDRDKDGVLSAAEIGSAADTLWKYDANQDESLSLAEINKAAERTPDDANGKSAAPPFVPLEQLAVLPVFQRICDGYPSALSRFDRDGDGTVSEPELTELRTAEPDFVVRVAFDTQDAARSRVELLAIHPQGEANQPMVRATSLTVPVGGTWLEFSIVQSPNGPQTDQISLGAVWDGYPLLPEIDSDEDGRLSVRELRQVSQRLAGFDRDGDGSVSRAELLPTLRVAFGLGPIVHRHLATVRSVRSASPVQTGAPPDWFTRMDRNQDGDLSPREFLGGREQFTKLDENNDGLISIAEALASEK
jgi:Ca2+-binding EF-hand superfamily protein